MRKSSSTRSDVLWRPTTILALLFGYFAIFGIIVGTQGVIWADVLAELRISVGVFGAAQLLSPLIAVVLLLLGGQLAARFGTQMLALGGLALLAASLVVLAEARSLQWLLVSLALGGAGNALLDSAMNSAALDWERIEQRHVINLLHAGFSAGTVVGALGSGTLREIGWDYGAILTLVAFLCALGFVATIPARFPPATVVAGEQAGAATATIGVLFSNATLIILAIICVLGLIGESASNSFGVIYLRSLGAPAFLGGLAFALFNAAMLVGRLLNAGLVARIGVKRALIIGALGHILGGVLLLLSNNVGIAVLAFLVTGVATAGVVPTVLSASAKIAPERTTTVTNALIAVIYVGFIIYPPVIGWVSDAISLHVGMFTIALAGLGMFILALRLKLDH